MDNCKKNLGFLFWRISIAYRTIPRQEDWLQAVGILGLIALLYLPIGFCIGFVRVQPELDSSTVLGVTLKAFLMPGLLEEGFFRVLLLPHPTELPATKTVWIAAGVSWILFMAYHIHPLTPAFFKEFPFLLGAGLLGAGCTISYLQSGSLWTPVVIHWLSVVVWLILLGGLAKFRT